MSIYNDICDFCKLAVDPTDETARCPRVPLLVCHYCQPAYTEAETVYGLLQRECGAHANDADSFILFYGQWLLDPRGPFEWRFMGKLGFGGKYFHQHEKRWVSCYPEDSTPEREIIVAAANTRLKAEILL